MSDVISHLDMIQLGGMGCQIVALVTGASEVLRPALKSLADKAIRLRSYRGNEDMARQLAETIQAQKYFNDVAEEDQYENLGQGCPRRVRSY